MTKVYDCFSFNGEWDLLELRLNSLDPVVDFFVITESIYTHMGKPKKLLFDFDDPRVADFKRKIRYIVVSDLPNVEVWANDRFQRNACTRGLWDAEPNSLIMISDCDELPKSSCVAAAKLYTDYSVFGFETTWHYCFMNNVNVAGHPPEISSVGVRHEQLGKLTPDDYRWKTRALEVPGIWVFPNAGWHYSYLMSKEKIIEKIQNFTHQEFNTPGVLSRLDPIKASKAGLDILGREHMRWSLQPAETLEIPDYVKKNWQKYQHYFLEP